jgi:hypothetical protein
LDTSLQQRVPLANVLDSSIGQVRDQNSVEQVLTEDFVGELSRAVMPMKSLDAGKRQWKQLPQIDVIHPVAIPCNQTW